MSSRHSIAILAALGLTLVGVMSWRSAHLQKQPAEPPVKVTKRPVDFATRSFDPAATPAEMPTLGAGEQAVCDSEFSSSASLAGEQNPSDATHAMLTITHVDVTLGLNVTIWVPSGATVHVIDHEDGHRQISEHYYQQADGIAERIAETYIGRQVPIAGADLNAAANDALHALATEFTNEYNKELNPEPAQQLYDNITDHSRNEMTAKDAVPVALQNGQMTAIPPAQK